MTPLARARSLARQRGFLGAPTQSSQQLGACRLFHFATLSTASLAATHLAWPHAPIWAGALGVAAGAAVAWFAQSRLPDF